MLKNKLKELREERGISQVELCEKTGLSRTTISKIENNEEVNLNTATIIKISEVFGLQPSEIFLW